MILPSPTSPALDAWLRHPCPRPAPPPFPRRLEEAYEGAVRRLGGLHEARPKALLEALQGEFPDLTLQNIKW